jgi:hypothetical protein
LAGAGLKAGAGALALTLPFTSPRLVGEVAYKVGQAARPFRNVPVLPLARGAFQAGRAARNPYATGTQ